MITHIPRRYGRVLLGAIISVFSFLSIAKAEVQTDAVPKSPAAVAAKAKHDAAVEKALGAYAVAKASIDKQYLDELANALSLAMKAGNLDEAKRIDLQRSRTDPAKADGDSKDIQLPKSPAAVAAKTRHDAAMKKAEAALRSARIGANKQYSADLIAPMREAMKASDLDEAKRLDAARKAAESENSQLERGSSTVGTSSKTSLVGWINLLDRVKPESDAVKGEWTLQGAQLSVAASPRAILRVPVTPEKAYEVRVEYRRSGEGDGETFGVHLPVGESGAVAMVSPQFMGLDMIDKKTWGTNDTTKSGNFGGSRNDKSKHVLDIAVWQKSEDARIIVAFDGKPQIDWHGPASSLSVYSPSAFPPPMSLGLLSINVPHTISVFAWRDLGDAPPPGAARK